MNFCSRFFLLLFSLVFAGDTLYSQNVIFVQDSSISRLLEKHKALNSPDPKIKGYRVQLVALSGNNARKDAENVRARFITMYPDIPAYLIPQLPNFKVRVGNFRDRFEAYRFYKEVKPQFPGAYIVSDIIGFPALDPWEPPTEE